MWGAIALIALSVIIMLIAAIAHSPKTSLSTSEPYMHSILKAEVNWSAHAHTTIPIQEHKYNNPIRFLPKHDYGLCFVAPRSTRILSALLELRAYRNSTSKQWYSWRYNKIVNSYHHQTCYRLHKKKEEYSCYQRHKRIGGGPITKVTVNAGSSALFDVDVLKMYSSYISANGKWLKTDLNPAGKKYVYICCASAQQFYNMSSDHIAVKIPIDILLKKLPKACLFEIATVMHVNSVSMKSSKQVIVDEIFASGNNLPSACIPVFKLKDAKVKDSSPHNTNPAHVVIQESIQEGHFPPEPPSRKLKDTIIRDYCAATAAPLINEAGCAVCGELTVQSLATPLNDIKDELEFLKDVGYFPSCGKKTEQNVLVAGCNIVCDSCLKYTSRSKMPPNAMANGLWLGDIPADLQDLTWAEQLLISKVRMNRFVVRVGSGRKKN